jgi:preprotein translocase subunit SecF
MSRLGSLGNKLYKGEVSYDFVGRQKRWYAVSFVILVVALGGLFFRGLDLGIEFKGGAIFTVKSAATVEEARAAAEKAGVTEAIVQKARSAQGETVRIQTGSLSGEERTKVIDTLSAELDVPKNDINTQAIGPSWGQQVFKRALYGLILFLVAVVIYLTMAFEWKMAVSAIIALAHDVVITVGVYALSGFSVTPATVTGLLTILGYSLYDTVVVFDKVRENTRGLAGGSRMTYSQAANLAVNQTLVRSINTSLIALLPVGALLFGGLVLLGEGVLADLALALFVGILAGAYSSIFIATPLLADLKEREPAMKALARRVEARRSGVPAKGTARQPAKAAAGSRSGSRQQAPASDDGDVIDAEVVDEGEEAAAVGAGATRQALPAGSRQQPKRTTPPRSKSGGGGKSKKRPSGKKRR